MSKSINNLKNLFYAILTSVLALLLLGVLGKVITAKRFAEWDKVVIYILPIIIAYFIWQKLFKDKRLNERQPKHLKAFLLSLPLYLISLILLYFRIADAQLIFKLNAFSAALACAIVVAVFEELVFRAININLLNKSFSKYSSVLLASLLFGLFHLGNLTITPNAPISVMTQVVYTFMLGIFWSAIYVKTDSLLMPILSHAFLDASSLIPEALMPPVNTNAVVSDITISAAISSLLWVLPIFILGFIYLFYGSKKNAKESKL